MPSSTPTCAPPALTLTNLVRRSDFRVRMPRWSGSAAAGSRGKAPTSTRSLGGPTTLQWGGTGDMNPLDASGCGGSAARGFVDVTILVDSRTLSLTVYPWNRRSEVSVRQPGSYVITASA